MNDDIEILEEIYKSDTGAYRICNAAYKNVPCYCIEHTGRNGVEITLFDGGESVCNAVIARMEKTKMGITVYGTQHMLFFHKRDKNCKISLRRFLWSKYKHISTKQVKKLRIMLHDVSTIPAGVIDMRECNLFDSDEISSADITTLFLDIG